jgi:hypothetical protein
MGQAEPVKTSRRTDPLESIGHSNTSFPLRVSVPPWCDFREETCGNGRPSGITAPGRSEPVFATATPSRCEEPPIPGTSCDYVETLG